MKKIIKTEDYCGGDRRAFKIKDNIITPTTIALIISAAISAGGYQMVVKVTADQTKENTENIKIIDKDVVVLKTQVPQIQNDIREVKDTQKEIQGDIKLVLRQLSQISKK